MSEENEKIKHALLIWDTFPFPGQGNDEFGAKAARLRLEGKTYREIGDDLGRSHQTAYILVKRFIRRSESVEEMVGNGFIRPKGSGDPEFLTLRAINALKDNFGVTTAEDAKRITFRQLSDAYNIGRKSIEAILEWTGRAEEITEGRSTQDALDIARKNLEKWQKRVSVLEAKLTND